MMLWWAIGGARPVFISAHFYSVGEHIVHGKTGIKLWLGRKDVLSTKKKVYEQTWVTCRPSGTPVPVRIRHSIKASEEITSVVRVSSTKERRSTFPGTPGIVYWPLVVCYFGYIFYTFSSDAFELPVPLGLPALGYRNHRQNKRFQKLNCTPNRLKRVVNVAILTSTEHLPL